MSGHSKWSKVKHVKAAVDAKRGRIFTRLIKEITVAARMGGGDPDGNPRLRRAIQDAKAENMPSDNIERAIKKGTGELEGVHYEEAHFEGYAPGGVALLVEVLTDNRNRTVSEIRHLFGKNGGNLGESGCVAWMFNKRGYIAIDRGAAEEDKVMSVALDAGAEDISEDEGCYEVYTRPEDFDRVLEAFRKAEIAVAESQLAMVPSNHLKVEPKVAQQVVRLTEVLEEHDDVQNVWTNLELDDATVAAMQQLA
ncbi:MAG TPA: YebC/PmpR family DNA-binding transcriptional regulator [Acidobacteriota bacterium]